MASYIGSDPELKQALGIEMLVADMPPEEASQARDAFYPAISDDPGRLGALRLRAGYEARHLLGDTVEEVTGKQDEAAAQPAAATTDTAAQQDKRPTVKFSGRFEDAVWWLLNHLLK